MILDYLPTQKDRFSHTLLEIMIDRPMDLVTCSVVNPILIAISGKYGMLHREYKDAMQTQGLINLPAQAAKI
jgi:hypothetical protein